MMSCSVFANIIGIGYFYEIYPQTQSDIDGLVSSKIDYALLGFFYENLGQVDNSDIRFTGRTGNGMVGFSENSIIVVDRNSSFTLIFQTENRAIPCGEDESVHKTNFIRGNDVRLTGIRGFSTIIYSDVWSGIDIRCTSTSIGIVIGFEISPYADPTSIKIKTSLSDSLLIDDESITVQNDQANIIIDNIEGYQDHTRISASFTPRDTDSFGINLDTGSSRSPITIQSILHSTSLGGSDFDVPFSIALDDSGYAYVTGYTVSSDFMIEDPLDSTFNGESDCFIFKIDLSDNSILYSTFVGGSDQDIGTGISIDSEGNVYVTGRTQSADFPTHLAYDSSFNGGLYDCYVFKLNSAGNQLLYSTFIGGSDNDYAESIDIDSSGVVYVTGYTSSSDFPTINGYNHIYNDGFSDTFVFKLDVDGEDLSYSTLIGGSRTDFATSITVDDAGCAYVAGNTYSDDFPVTSASDYTYNGYRDAFVYKLSSNGGQLIYSTFLGGSWIDQAESISVDIHGNAIVTGTTFSDDFPTQNPFDSTHNGGADCFVTAIGPTGDSLLLSTFLGGTGDDFGFCLSVDSLGYVYVSGDTDSLNFPTHSTDSSVMNGTSSTFVSKFNISLDTLLYSTFLGGYQDKSVRSLAVDPDGVAYIAGYRAVNKIESNLLGSFISISTDVFVLKLLDFGDSDFDTLADHLENELGFNRFSDDSDMDGISDALEHKYLGTDPLSNDTDSDNLIDGLEVNMYRTNPLLSDSDLDDLDDGLEVLILGTNPLSNDTDHDTLYDYDEVNIYGTSPIISDSDNDTISDADEIFLHGTNPLLNDTDFDLMLDAWEIFYGLNPLIDDSLDDLDTDTLLNIEEFLNGTQPNNNDTDSDAIDDALEVNVYGTDPLLSDSDNDKLSDFDEIFLHGTNPLLKDTDFDLMPDSWEIQHGLDALADDTLGDPDSDVLTNLDEYLYGADPNNNDTDSDQIEDWPEVYTYGTSPISNDTDSDTLYDYDEIMIHSTNPLSNDTDLDDLLDQLEILTYFTNPLLNDTDLDLMFDGWEALYSLDPLVNDSADDEDEDQLLNLEEYLIGTNPQNNDTDLDSLDDFAEINDYSTDPLSNDSDNDFVSDYDEIFTYYIDPNNNDSDFDLMLDGWEILYGLDPDLNDTQDDLDFDGLTNLLEFLSGANPLLDDSDNDTLDDYLEVVVLGTSPGNNDTDFDGMPDFWEITYGLNATSNDALEDLDADGLPNIFEYNNTANPLLHDTDFDGLSDLEEVTIYHTNASTFDSDNDTLSDIFEVKIFGTNPNSVDTDNDTMSDSWEVSRGLNPLVDDRILDYDFDNLTNFEEYQENTNPFQSDSDSDALSDYDELKVHLTNPNSDDSDLDELDDFTEIVILGTNPLSNDTDLDQLPDSWEVSMGLDPLIDDASGDADSDEITNLQEYQYGSNPLLVDSDSDDLTDTQEINTYNTDPSAADSDRDGLSDAEEVQRYHTDPLLFDSDNDGIRDGLEILVFLTNPLNNDTDSDFMLDGWEIDFDLDPLVADGAIDFDTDGLTNLEEYELGTNPNLIDSDNDNLDDLSESETYGTSPVLADTDLDNIPDDWELLFGFNPLSNDSYTDSDTDGLFEFEEYQYGSSPFSSDTDSDGLGDFDEAKVFHSNLSSSDSDMDGLLDFDEIMLLGTSPLSDDTDDDGMPDSWEVTHNLNATFNDADLDVDLDKLTHLNEYLHHTDPNNPDSDADGLMDSLEVNEYGTNPLLVDTDLDNLSDYFEIFTSGSNPLLNDTDYDDLIDSLEVDIGTNPNSSDSDFDGISDTWEFLNGYDPINPYIPLQEFLHYNILLISLISIIGIILLGVIYKRRFW